MTSRRLRTRAWGLVIVWAGLLLMSYVVSAASSMRLRVASSAVLVAASWCLAASARHRWRSSVIALGMTLGFLGDAWNLVPASWYSFPRLLPPMILFGSGHVAYITAIIDARREVTCHSRWPNWWVWPYWFLFVLLA